MQIDVLEEELPLPPPEQRQTILIVEDDETTAEMLKWGLTQQGYQTAVAHSGRAAAVSLESDRPDLVLLDVRLPDIDGLDLCQRLVDDPQTSEIPIIVVSGLDHPDIVRQARSAGCQFFLHKPYDPNALLILIQQALDDAQSL